MFSVPHPYRIFRFVMEPSAFVMEKNVTENAFMGHRGIVVGIIEGFGRKGIGSGGLELMATLCKNSAI